MKASCDSLVIEITRRCNMGCAHCMRGDAQNMDISEKVIDAALSKVDSISSLTLTGGEPSLNIPAIRYITKRLKDLSIPLGSAYIVTNGKEVSNDFIFACLELFMLADEPEFNGLALSQDMFHEDVPMENVSKLRQLTAFTGEDKNTDFDRVPLLDLGRARNLNSFAKRGPVHDAFTAIVDNGILDLSESTLTVTVNGDLLTECDYAYDDTDGICIGNVLHGDWVKNIAASYADDAA